MWSRKFHKRNVRRKLRWPTGTPFDQILDYIGAWNRLRYRPRIIRPRTYSELILASKYWFKGDMALARRVSDKVEFKVWLNETPEWRKLIIPTLAVFDSARELDGKVFQSGTILKPTHLSGPILIFDRTRILTDEEIRKAEGWLKLDYYQRSREPCYKGMKKRLILEPLLCDETGEMLKDYKFHMFNSRCLKIQVVPTRLGGITRQYYSTDWDLLDFTSQYPRYPEPFPRPAQLEDAINVAAQLARPFSICRVDLYLPPDGTIKAGEITFFPGGGSEPFTPPEADLDCGRRARALLAG